MDSTAAIGSAQALVEAIRSGIVAMRDAALGALLGVCRRTVIRWRTELLRGGIIRAYLTPSGWEYEAVEHVTLRPIRPKCDTSDTLPLALSPSCSPSPAPLPAEKKRAGARADIGTLEPSRARGLEGSSPRALETANEIAELLGEPPSPELERAVSVRLQRGHSPEELLGATRHYRSFASWLVPAAVWIQRVIDRWRRDDNVLRAELAPAWRAEVEARRDPRWPAWMSVADRVMVMQREAAHRAEQLQEEQLIEFDHRAGQEEQLQEEQLQEELAELLRVRRAGAIPAHRAAMEAERARAELARIEHARIERARIERERAELAELPDLAEVLRTGVLPARFAAQKNFA